MCAVLKVIRCGDLPCSVSDPPGMVSLMERKIWTAAELEKMTPAERREISRAAVITDPAEIPPEMMDRARDIALRHIEATEQQSAS